MTALDDEIAQRLQLYFGDRLAAYGDDPRGVDWHSAAAQQARFDALLAIGLTEGATVLDAGCGLGHLYAYLCERGIVVRYTGCDLSEAHVERARVLYPQARFIAADAARVAAAETFDYVIACGLLHLRVPRWGRWAWTLVRALYAGCRTGLAFTVPQRGYGHPPALATVDPADWSARLRTLCPDVATTTLAPWGDAVFFLHKSVQSETRDRSARSGER